MKTKIVLISLAAGLFIFFMVYLLGYFPGISYGEGTRSGVVYRISHKGLFFKTWEGELSIGLNEVEGDGTIVPKVFAFSVADPAVVEKLKAAEKAGKRVTLQYNDYFLRGSMYGSTNYNITAVE